jgi:hypothetical protein
MKSMICPRCSRVVDIHVVISMSGKCPSCLKDIRAEVEIWYPETANKPGRLSFVEEAGA